MFKRWTEVLVRLMQVFPQNRTLRFSGSSAIVLSASPMNELGSSNHPSTLSKRMLQSL